MAEFLTVPAHAQSITGYGSGVYTTLRSCGLTASTAACDGTGPGQRIIQDNRSGGAGVEANTTFAGTGVGAGSSAFGSVTFGAVGLPQVKAAAVAAGNVRVNSNVYFYQTYTYGGVDPIAFGLAGNVHIDSSTSDGGNGTLANGAILFANLAIWNAADFFAFSDAQSFVDNPGYFGANCTTAGVLANGSASTALPGGERTYAFTTSSCSANPLMLQSGQQFVVAGLMQFPVNRGGSIDATHTFDVLLDPALGEQTIAALQTSLDFVAGVPEPASWITMILGFGAIGAMLRHRPARALAA